MLTHTMATTAAASSTTALPVSVRRNARTGAGEAALHGVRLSKRAESGDVIGAQARRSTDPAEPPGVDVEDEPTDLSAHQVRRRPDPLHVAPHSALLICRRQERHAAGVGAAGVSDRSVHVVFRATRHPASGV